jgi:hypothetical protein
VLSQPPRRRHRDHAPKSQYLLCGLPASLVAQ